MNIIKRFSLIIICFILVFSCCPIISFAWDYKGDVPLVSVFGGEYHNLIASQNGFNAENFTITPVSGFNVFAFQIVKQPNDAQSIILFSWDGSFKVNLNRYYDNGTFIRSFEQNGNTQYKNDFYYTFVQWTSIVNYSRVSTWDNIPLLTVPNFVQNDILEMIFTGVIPSGYSISTDGISEPIDPRELGFIKPSYFVNNALLTGPMTVADTPETITWENTSTTGYDLNQNGVQIRFMIKDRSVYQRNEDAWGTGTLGSINNFITNITGFLSSNLFPNGSWQKSWLRGDVTRSDTHEQFFGQKFSYPGSRGKASFNWLASYRDHPQIQISTYANDMLSTNKTFYESLYQNTLGDFTIPYISWDIYAQIIAPDGTEGNWLKIDKHGAPFQEQGNRLDGGVTDEPVQINPSIPDNNIWNDGDETPLEDDDDDDPLPVGYVDPGSGDTYNEYNNYTYNYDNRSWIENHYDNSTVESVNEGIDWIKLFPGFFGLFLKFFGAFLPSWAVACVTIGIPIILGLILFRLIKGVIPFV